MSFYVILFASIIIIGLLLYNTSLKARTKNIIFLVLSGALLTVLSAIRYDVGIDYSYVYAPIYEQLVSTGFLNFAESRHELGYVLLEFVTSLISVNYQTIFIITSVLCISLLFCGFYKYSPNAVVSVFLFLTWGYFFCSMNFVRQFIAAGILLYAVMFIKSRKPVAFLLLVLLAASFHKTALIIIPFYFILQIKITKKVLLIYSGLTLFLFMFSGKLIGFVASRFFPWYLQESTSFLESGLSLSTILMPLVVFVVLFIYSDLLCAKDDSNRIYLSAAFFMLFFHIMSLRYALMDRFVIFFAPVLMVGLAVLTNQLIEQRVHQNRLVPIVTMAILLLTCFWTTATQLSMDGHGVVPYQTVFSQTFYYEYSASLKKNGVQPEDGSFAAIAKPFRPNGFADLHSDGPQTEPDDGDIILGP